MAGKTQTWGQAFGALIREKRGQEGITQKELAVQAFDDESKVRRIIELENGQTSRPHTKTVDPLRAFFGITAEEMATCYEHSRFSEDEQNQIGLDRILLENLAARFDHENPGAPDEELIQFLNFKTSELREIKRRLKDLEQFSEGLDNQIAAATFALEKGDFENADQILATAEELHQEERTLQAVRQQAAIRSTRGDSALFKGDRDTAILHYETAAGFLKPFDESEAALLLEEQAGRMYEWERRIPNGDLSGALQIARSAFEMSNSQPKPAATSRSAFHLALVEVTHGRTQRTEGIQLVEDALKHAEYSISVFEDKISDFDRSSSKVVIANALIALANLGKDTEVNLRKGISVLNELITNDCSENSVIHKCHIYNNLAASQRHLSKIVNDDEREELLDEAKRNLFLAIQLSSDEGVADVWQAAQFNLGSHFAEHAQSLEGSDAAFTRVQAIAAYQSAIEAFPQENFSLRLAEANLSLARVLLDSAKDSQQDLREIYLLRSISSSQIAATVYSEAEIENQIAEAEFLIGLAYLSHSQIAKKVIAIEDLRKAKAHIESSKSKYKEKNPRKKLETYDGILRSINYELDKLT